MHTTPPRRAWLIGADAPGTGRDRATLKTLLSADLAPAHRFSPETIIDARSRADTVTIAIVEKALEEAAQFARGGAIFVWIGGHGAVDELGQGFLRCDDYRPSRNPGLTLNRLWRHLGRLAKAGPHPVVVVLDFCHAGHERPAAPIDGLVVIGAAEGDEIARGDSRHGGWLTQRFASALLNRRTSRPDGAIDVAALDAALRADRHTEQHGYQRPWVLMGGQPDLILNRLKPTSDRPEWPGLEGIANHPLARMLHGEAHVRLRALVEAAAQLPAGPSAQPFNPPDASRRLRLALTQAIELTAPALNPVEAALLLATPFYIAAMRARAPAHDISLYHESHRPVLDRAEARGPAAGQRAKQWTRFCCERDRRAEWTAADVPFAERLGFDPGLVATLAAAGARGPSALCALPQQRPFRLDEAELQIRPQLLGALLWLAEWLWPRPGIYGGDLVEASASIDGVLDDLSAARFRAGPDGLLTLAAECGDPLADRAAHAVCEAFDAALATFPNLGLPVHVWPRHARAQTTARIDVETGLAAYLKPTVSLSMGAEDARRLLMDTRLWSDPAFAARELYQNALDACRYRRCRAQANGLNHIGSIIFRLGVTEGGRRYLECEDDGIGMDAGVLRECFARAGKRFATRPEFLRERTEWAAAGIEMRINSRFGLGVFSYFMLANELEVETCRVGAKGRGLGRRLWLSARADTGLVTLREAAPNEGSLAGAGTRARLYLHDEAEVALIELLDDFLWHTEVEVYALDDDGEDRSWAAGALHLPTGSEALIGVPGRLWWVVRGGTGLRRRPTLVAAEPTLSDGVWRGVRRLSGADRPPVPSRLPSGAVLVDGVKVSEGIPGVVINLDDRDGAVLSVDRCRLIDAPLAAARRLRIEALGPLRAAASRGPLDADFLQALWAQWPLTTLALLDGAEPRAFHWRKDSPDGRWIGALCEAMWAPPLPTELPLVARALTDWDRAYWSARGQGHNPGQADDPGRAVRAAVDLGPLELLAAHLWSIPLPARFFALIETSRVAPARCAAALGKVHTLIEGDDLLAQQLRLALSDLEDESLDLALLSAQGDGRAPWLQIAPTATHVLQVARLTGADPAGCAQRMALLARRAGWAIPWRPAAFEGVSLALAEDDELLEAVQGRLKDQLFSAVDLLALADILGREVREIEAPARALARALGYTGDWPESAPTLDALDALDALDRKLLSRNGDGHGPWRRQWRAGDVAHSAQRTRISVDEAAHRMGQFGLALGVDGPLDSLDGALTATELQLLDESLTGLGPWAVFGTGDPPAARAAALKALRERLGHQTPWQPVALEGIDAQLSGWSQLVQDLRNPKSWDGGELPDWLVWNALAWRKPQDAQRFAADWRILQQLLSTLGRTFGFSPPTPAVDDAAAAWLAGAPIDLRMVQITARRGPPERPEWLLSGLFQAPKRAQKLIWACRLTGRECPGWAEAATRLDARLTPRLLSAHLNGRRPWLRGRVGIARLLAMAALFEVPLPDIWLATQTLGEVFDLTIPAPTDRWFGVPFSTLLRSQTR